ncbi:MAG: HEAT repeat domain-containing protein [Balneolaceae bacterium]|nr:HEAT repeat domain-containing protein [Balneolaceae bacterium]
MSVRSIFTDHSKMWRSFFHGALTLFFLFSMAACSQEEPDPQIIKLTDQEAAQDAEQIRGEVTTELAEGMELSLWASEKLLADPIGMDINNKGQAYITVTERSTSSEFDIRGHQNWMIESISWETVQDRQDFLHRELAPENSEQNDFLQDHNGDGSHDWRDLTVEQEKVYTIEDSSGDGIADRSQLYISDFSTEVSDVLGAVLAHENDIYLGVAPDMWRTTDTDADGMSDTKTSISNGYHVHIGFSGHGMSGAEMGPDGRIYWGIGDIGFNVEGPDGKTWAYPDQGAILRSEPDGSNFEVFAAGVRNTHEITFDKYGNLISVDNDGDHAGEYERVVYLVNGSDSGWRANWQYGKYVDPKNNEYKVWMDENYFKTRFEDQAAIHLPPIAPYHSGPAGMVYNPGTALSDKWDDHFFVSEFTGSPARSAIHGFTLEPSGASFELKSDQPIVEGILATGMDFGPDGSLYFADWIEGWDTKDKGRIWKVDTPSEANSEIRKETKQLLAEDFSNREVSSLTDLLSHEDMRVRMNAQFELAERGENQALLDVISQSDNQLARLHGMWGIWELARQDINQIKPLVQYLEDEDAEIRAQAAKILRDERYEDAASNILPLLKDESLRVQFFATEALGRIGYEDAVQPIISMLEANNDEDVYLRHGGAIALARIGNNQALADLADHSSEAVRIAAVVALKRLEEPAVADFLDDESEFVVTNAARAINDDAHIEEAIPALAEMLDQQRFTNEPLIRRAINANLYSGSSTDADRLASFALRQDVPEELRVEAINTLSVWPDPSILDRVTGRHRGQIQNNRSAATEAIASLIDPIYNDGDESVKVALTEAVASLNYEPATSAVFALIENDPSANVKIAALNALQEMGYENMGEAVSIALDDNQQSVRMTALGIIPSLEIEESRKVELLSSVLGSGSYIEQQSALKALGEMNTESANDILEKQLTRLINGDIPSEIQLELIQAAKSSSSPSLQALVDQYESSKQKGDMAARFKETLRGGNAQEGAQIFYQNNAAQCIRCHAIGGRGGDVGPELANIGNLLNREQLLESLVDPGARIAPGYGSIAVTLENGETTQGILREETESYVVLQSSDGERQQIQKDRITERTNSPSAMYSMSDILTKNQIRDLVEFLAQQRGNEND